MSIMILSSTTSCVSAIEHLFDDMANKETTAVLCIGMENSRKFGNCSGSRIDAVRMHKTLSKYAKNATLLVSEQAVKNVVIQKMIEACQKDLAIIYYSGHGGEQKQTAASKQNYAESTGNDQFLCLYDNKMLDDEIWEIISHAKGRVVMIFDCCHAQTMYRSPMPFGFGKNATFDNGLFGESNQKNEPRILVISGCPDNTVSYGDASGGLLTNAFLAYFKENMTYERMWKLLHSNYSLNKAEQVQFTEIGKSFKDYLIFR